MTAWRCAVGVALIALVIMTSRVDAVAPPGQDHAWNVTFSTTAAGAHPDVTSTLNLCTDGTGLPGIAHECSPPVPAPPLFDAARIIYTGLRTSPAPVAARIARLTIDAETNAGQLQNVPPDSGQPVPCGSLLHTSLPAFDVWAGARTGAVVSMDASAVNGFSFDQLDDASQFDPTPGGAQGDGWPSGIRSIPAVIPSVLALMGLPDSAVINRGYAVASGSTRTSISVLTVFSGSQQGTDATTTLVIFGNPFGAQSVAKTDVLNCAPFSSTLVSLGLTSASSGSTSINGGVIAGDFNPPAPGGATLLTICDGAAPVGATCSPSIRSYSLALSMPGDDDGDGVFDVADDCPTVADPIQASFAGIGDACGGTLGANAGTGYDNNNATAIAAFSDAACSGLPHTDAKALSCKDVDGDGVKNAVDNCPFAPNATQQNRDGDSRGDACEGSGTDPALGSNMEAATPGDYSGLYVDSDDRCDAVYSVGGPASATTTCLSFTAAPGPAGCCTGPNHPFLDANDDSVPDFLLSGATVSRDHRSDTNGDGYSDADEGTPANCGGAGCAVFQTYGAAETRSCHDPGRNCGNGAVGPLGLPRSQANGSGSGCATTVDKVGPVSTMFLAKSDIDLDGDVTILDIAQAGAWYGEKVRAPDDPRWEANIDGDGTITILDLAMIASNFLRNVAAGCDVS